MDAVTIRIGPLVFDHADYEAYGDVLYLHLGAPQPAKAKRPGRDTWSVRAGHPADPRTNDHQRQARHRPSRQTRRHRPETVEASSDELAAALKPPDPELPSAPSSGTTRSPAQHCLPRAKRVRKGTAGRCPC